MTGRIGTLLAIAAAAVLGSAAPAAVAQSPLFDGHGDGGARPSTRPATPRPPGGVPPGRPDAPAAADDGEPRRVRDAYDADLVRAKRAYLRALLDADERLVRALDAAARDAGDADGVRRDAAARAREHAAALRTLDGDPAALVISARWGTGGRWLDVTDRVRRMAGSTDRPRADPATLGGDPAPGWRKVLEVVYAVGGERRRAVVPEDAEVEVPWLIPKAAGGVEPAAAADERPAAAALDGKWHGRWQHGRSYAYTFAGGRLTSSGGADVASRAADGAAVVVDYAAAGRGATQVDRFTPAGPGRLLMESWPSRADYDAGRPAKDFGIATRAD